MTPHITAHALTRAIERIPGVSTEAMARVILTSPTVLKAIEFGARYVRLPTRQRIVIVDGAIVTVLTSDKRPGTMGRESDRIREMGRG